MEARSLKVLSVAARERFDHLNSRSEQLERTVIENHVAQQRVCIDLAVEQQAFDQLVPDDKNGTTTMHSCSISIGPEPLSFQPNPGDLKSTKTSFVDFHGGEPAG